MNRALPGFTAEAMRRLESHSWPGNVRELSNAIERAMVVQRGAMIGVEDLPIEGRSGQQRPNGARTLSEVERNHVLLILEETHWNISEASRVLGVDRGTVYNKIKHYGLQRSEDRGHVDVGRGR